MSKLSKLVALKKTMLSEDILGRLWLLIKKLIIFVKKNK